MTRDELVTHMALAVRDGIREAVRDLAVHEGEVGHDRQVELLAAAIAHAVKVEGHADLVAALDRALSAGARTDETGA